MANAPNSKPEQNDNLQGQQSAAVPAAQQSPQTTSNKDAGKIHWPVFRAVFFGVAAVMAVAGLFYQGVHWLEERIDKAVEIKLSEPVILRKIAQESRPILVFNADESIVADGGASQFVKELKITARSSWEKNVNLPDHIHIEFTKFLQSAPIITPLSQMLGVVTAKRGTGLSWEFEFAWGGYTPGQNQEHQLFRLEILP